MLEKGGEPIFFGVKTMSELENNFKRAFIKFVEIELPKLIIELKAFNQNEVRRTQGMEELARAIRLMPTSIRMHP